MKLFRQDSLPGLDQEENIITYFEEMIDTIAVRIKPISGQHVTSVRPVGSPNLVRY
jgi:hypothetical protein